MSIGVPAADSKSLLSGFTPAGAGDTCSSSDSWQDLGAMLNVGQELGWKEAGWGLLWPRYGNHMGLSLCVSEVQTSACQFPLRNTHVSTQQDIRTAGHMRVYFRLGQQVTSQEACPQCVHIFPAVSSLSPRPQPRAKMRGSKLLRVTLVHVPPTQELSRTLT